MSSFRRQMVRTKSSHRPQRQWPRSRAAPRGGRKTRPRRSRSFPTAFADPLDSPTNYGCPRIPARLCEPFFSDRLTTSVFLAGGLKRTPNRTQPVHVSQEYHTKPGRFVAFCGGSCPVSSLTAGSTAKARRRLSTLSTSGAGFATHTQLETPLRGVFFSRWL